MKLVPLILALALGVVIGAVAYPKSVKAQTWQDIIPPGALVYIDDVSSALAKTPNRVVIHGGQTVVGFSCVQTDTTPRCFIASK